MDQKYKIIKGTIDHCREIIKEQEKIIEEKRKECDHPKEYYKTIKYMPRPGQIWDNTIICGICGNIMEGPFQYNMNIKGHTDD